MYFAIAVNTGTRRAIRSGCMKTLLIPLALVATAAAVPASAKQELDIRTATVGFADLDLASAKGQAELDSRIAIAARQVCDESGFRSARASAEQRACRIDAGRRAKSDAIRLASRTRADSRVALAVTNHPGKAS